MIARFRFHSAASCTFRLSNIMRPRYTVRSSINKFIVFFYQNCKQRAYLLVRYLPGEFYRVFYCSIVTTYTDISSLVFR